MPNTYDKLFTNLSKTSWLDKMYKLDNWLKDKWAICYHEDATAYILNNHEPAFPKSHLSQS